MLNVLLQVLPFWIAIGITTAFAADYSEIDWKNAYWEPTTEEKAEFTVTVTSEYKNGFIDTDTFLMRYAGEKVRANPDGTKTFRGWWGRGRSGRRFSGSVNIKDITEQGIVIRASLTYEGNRCDEEFTIPWGLQKVTIESNGFTLRSAIDWKK